MTKTGRFRVKWEGWNLCQVMVLFIPNNILFNIIISYLSLYDLIDGLHRDLQRSGMSGGSLTH